MGNARILIVEDNIVVAEDIRVKLGHMGYSRAVIATSYEKAIKAAETRLPDLALMDINLGGGRNGIDTAAELRQSFRVPVVYLTAYADDATIGRAKITEPYGYLVKPFDDSALKSAIEIALYKKEKDKKLWESRQWLKTTLTSIGDGVIATDNQGHVTFMNPVAESLTGWTGKDAGGRPIGDVLHIINESTLLAVDNPVEKVLREGVIMGLANHTLLISREGGRIPIADSGAPIKNEQGDIIGAVLVFRDQSEERARQQAVEESEKKYRSLFRNAQVGLSLTRISDGRVLTCNEKMAQIFGYDDTAEFTEAYVFSEKYVDPEKRAWMLKELHKTGFLNNIEAEFFGKNGEKVWVRFDTRIFPDYGYMQDVVMDISESKRTEEALRASEAKYRSMMEAMKDPIYICSSDFRVEYMNPAMIQRVGRDATGEHCFQSIHDMDNRCSWCERISNHQGEGTEFEVVSPKDNRSYLLSQSPVERADGSVSRMTVCRDVTDFRKMEDQLRQSQKMESVGRLAGGVAHDFNNMLGVILGYTELAMENVAPDDPIHGALQEILNAARRSADITRQLLAFARKQTISPKVLDLNETIEGMLKMIRRLIGENIDLAWLPGANLRPVWMDPSQIDQILANLCVNARDAISDVGRITIETGRATFDEAYCADHLGYIPGEYVLLAVSDDGSGMAPETLSNLFEPFFTTKEVGRGTGLGLATVYGIVKQNKGFINVYSEPEKGSVFRIYLPIHDTGSEAIPRKEPAAIDARGSETILLVEDEPAILRMTTMMLELLGYTVLSAGTPGKAIQLAQEHSGEIHLLMTDVVMPEMNGRDLAGNLLALYPNLKRLFMSGYTANVIAHHGLLDEGVNFIQKPFARKDLACKVREVLAETKTSGHSPETRSILQ